MEKIQASFLFINNWFYILIIAAILNMFIDFGLPLTFGNTYSTFLRNFRRVITCRICKKKFDKRFKKEADDDYVDIQYK